MGPSRTSVEAEIALDDAVVAGEIGGTSHLGEVWYAEALAPTGPFEVAVKVVSHDATSFYNVCHHDFLDRDGGSRGERHSYGVR